MIARRIEAAEGKDELPATASANGGSGRAHEQTADTAERKRFLLLDGDCSSQHEEQAAPRRPSKRTASRVPCLLRAVLASGVCVAALLLAPTLPWEAARTPDRGDGLATPVVEVDTPGDPPVMRVSREQHVRIEQLEQSGCIPCDVMFRKVEDAQFGTRVQDVAVQVRGEPKSGTTFMYEWAANALVVACGQLERMYGLGTCAADFEWVYNGRDGEIAPISSNATTKNMKQLFLVFDPKRGQGPASSGGTDVVATCPCENLDRVTVSINNVGKHSFPVGSDCAWQHINNVTPAQAGCRTVDGRGDGRKVEDYRGTASCFNANPCKVVGDDRQPQMLILRDPRAVTVSTYFYLKLRPNAPAHPIAGESIDDFVERMMPTICRYIHVRYLLLMERMVDKTTLFLFDETWADPVGWHRRFMSMIGLSPLDSIVEKAADLAIRRDFGFRSPGVDVHLGGAEVAKSRTWEDEVSANLNDRMNEMCHMWLPPALLETLDILPQYW